MEVVYQESTQLQVGHHKQMGHIAKMCHQQLQTGRQPPTKVTQQRLAQNGAQYVKY